MAVCPNLLTCKCGSLDLAAVIQAVGNVWHQAAALLRTLIKLLVITAAHGRVCQPGLISNNAPQQLTCQWLDLHPEQQKLD